MDENASNESEEANNRTENVPISRAPRFRRVDMPYTGERKGVRSFGLSVQAISCRSQFELAARLIMFRWSIVEVMFKCGSGPRVV